VTHRRVRRHIRSALIATRWLAVVIDPRRDVDEYLRLARENDLSVAYILETHRQEDSEFSSGSLV
jgi:hypothetical protein